MPSMGQSGGLEHHLGEASMDNANTIGLDLVKNVFAAHEAFITSPVLNSYLGSRNVAMMSV
jgi:hypothetical protein